MTSTEYEDFYWKGEARNWQSAKNLSMLEKKIAAVVQQNRTQTAPTVFLQQLTT